MDWRIGCSGFYYKEWKDFFYPAGLPQKKWFEYYCEYFNTIEINSSFYRQPSAKSFATWYDTSPANFLFTIKAPRTITHYGKFQETASLISDFYQVTANGLKDKLGCVLFQMPPSFSYTEERLNSLLEQLDPGFKNVVEPRHISWWNNRVMQAFREHHITFSGISYPSSLPDDIIQHNELIYYRFHGKPVLYKSLYAEKEIQEFAAAIEPGNKQVFVYFNNTWGTSALTNAKQLQSITLNL